MDLIFEDIYKQMCSQLSSESYAFNQNSQSSNHDNQNMIGSVLKLFEQSLQNINQSTIKNMNNNNNLNNKLQENQNLEHNKIYEVMDYDKTSFNTFELTKRKGLNEIQLTDLEEKNYQQRDNDIHKTILYNNEQSSISLRFDKELNQFIVTKQNKGEEELFFKECKILNQLKGKSITLDIVSVNYDNYEFQQIAGKSDLFQLKKKCENNIIFQVYYFILLNKLNKMHELGIAHSDIKPQNIMISYENIPFFIDFGASISLKDENDHENYLKYLTTNYNLNVYIEKSGRFKSQKEIEFCDRVQLSLTFLYLLCENNYDQNLFKSKQYNDLFQILSDKYDRNTKIIFYHISRILNEADSEIIVTEYFQELQYQIEEKSIVNALFQSSDVVFEKGVYKVLRINKFSVLLIYLLDKYGFNLQIDPEKIFITFLPDMKEFQYIYQKYRVQDHFQNLVNSEFYFDYPTDCYDIFEYIKSFQVRRINIKAINSQIIFEQLNKIQLVDSLQINMDINIFYLSQLIDNLKCENNFAFLKNLKIQQDRIICGVVIDRIQTLQKSDVNVQVDIFQHLYYYVIIKHIQDNYQIRQLDVNYKLQQFDKFNTEKLEKIIQSIDLDYKFCIYIQHQESLIQKELINSYQTEKKLNKFKLLKLQSSKKIEQFICDVLQIKQLRERVVIKIYDHNFHDIQLILDIILILGSQDNLQIEIQIINCNFSQEFASDLKDQQSDELCLQFKDDYIQQHENQFECQKHRLIFEFTQKQKIDKSFNIIFYNKIIFQTQQQEQQQCQIKQQNQQQHSQQSMNYQIDNQDIKRIQSVLEKNEQQLLLELSNLNEIKIQYKQQESKQSFLSKDNKIKVKAEITEIDFLIQNLKKYYYDEIKIIHSIKKNPIFLYSYDNRIGVHNIRAQFDSQDIETMNLFKKVYFALSNNNQRFENKDMQYFTFYKLLNQTWFFIKYPSYYISKKIFFQKLNKFQYSKKLQFLRQGIDSCLSDIYELKIFSFSLKLYNTSNLYEEVDQIKEILNNNEFEENFNQIQQFINLLIPEYLFKKQKELMIQIDLDQQGVDNTCFKVIIEAIEKLIPQNKIYSINYSFLTGQSLYIISEYVKKYKHLLYFDLQFNLITYSELKQFVYYIKENNQINSFSFEIINGSCKQYKNLIKNFDDCMSVIKLGKDIIFQSKSLNQSQNEILQIKIILNFSHFSQEEEFLMFDQAANNSKQSQFKTVTSNLQQLMNKMLFQFANHNGQEFNKSDTIDQLNGFKQIFNKFVNIDCKKYEFASFNNINLKKKWFNKLQQYQEYKQVKLNSITNQQELESKNDDTNKAIQEKHFDYENLKEYLSFHN